MSRNGSGTYVLPAGNPVVTGTIITSTWANTTMSDVATALTGSVASDGQTVMTGNLQMGSNRITGLADGIAPSDASTVGQTTNANITSGNINGAVIGNLDPKNGTFTNLVATLSATVPTMATSDDSTKAASTAYVKALIAGGENVVNSFNGRKGAVTLTSGDVTTALGYTPPTPTGTGANGTWGISVTGNSASVTNGVYTETDQTINGTKTFNATIIGNISGNAGTSSSCTGNSATATNATNATNFISPNFKMIESGGKLYFQYQGNNIATIDSAGNFTTVANVTAFAPSV